MIDPALERRYADCTELVDAWKAFLELTSVAMKTPQNINPQLEQQFLAAKARVAMLHDSFMDSLKTDRQTGANMLGLVNRSITLGHISRMGTADHKKTEIEWHEVYLLLSDTLASLETDRQKLAQTSAFSHALKRTTDKILSAILTFLRSTAFKVILVLAVIIGAFSSVFLFEDELRQKDWSAKHYAKLLKFQRETLNMDVPYSNLGEFTTLAFGDGATPDGITAIDIGQQTKDAIALIVQRFAGENSAKLIREVATESEHRQFTTNVRTPQTNIFLLYFFFTSEAINFENTFKSENKQDSIIVMERKANVVALCTSQDPNFRASLKRFYIDPMKPNPTPR